MIFPVVVSCNYRRLRPFGPKGPKYFSFIGWQTICVKMSRLNIKTYMSDNQKSPKCEQEWNQICESEMKPLVVWYCQPSSYINVEMSCCQLQFILIHGSWCVPLLASSLDCVSIILAPHTSSLKWLDNFWLVGSQNWDYLCISKRWVAGWILSRYKPRFGFLMYVCIKAHPIVTNYKIGPASRHHDVDSKQRSSRPGPATILRGRGRRGRGRMPVAKVW